MNFKKNNTPLNENISDSANNLSKKNSKHSS